MRSRRPRPPVDLGAFAGFRFPPEVIMLAVRWYLRFGLSYRDLQEILAERGIAVDHVTLFRWVLNFTPCSSTQRGRAGMRAILRRLRRRTRPEVDVSDRHPGRRWLGVGGPPDDGSECSSDGRFEGGSGL